jgi:hypothetical protein
LAFVTSVVALVSTFLGYQWQDRLADEVARADQNHRRLLAEAEAELQHTDVQRPEEAVAVLRPAIAQSLQWAYGQLLGPRSVPADEVSAYADHLLPMLALGDEALVDIVLVLLLGPEIRSLTPL